ncbi:hypothetical protein GC167_02310 [bacterium]|nr:hypothetical protein [bacterium]
MEKTERNRWGARRVLRQRTTALWLFRISAVLFVLILSLLFYEYWCACVQFWFKTGTAFLFGIVLAFLAHYRNLLSKSGD